MRQVQSIKPSFKYEIINSITKYPITSMCKIAKVSKSGYYKWLKTKDLIKRMRKNPKNDNFLDFFASATSKKNIYIHYIIMEIILNNKHNTNFCGFKNVIATEIRSNNNKVSCLSVQLNDTGYNDLSKWQEIQKKLKPYSPVSDLLLLSHIDTGEHSAYILNGYNISVSPKLCGIASRKEEEWIFKFYTFLASLTKRIQDAPFFSKNNAFLGKVAGYSMQQLINLGFEKSNAIDIITYGLISSEKDIRRVAKSISDDVHQSMIEYIG